MGRQFGSSWRTFTPPVKVVAPGPRMGEKPGQSKFFNTPTTVGEIRFASKGEALLHEMLLFQQQQGIVSYFLRQVPFHLPGGVTYRLDFLVYYTDGRIRHLDFKGALTPIFILKKKQVEALYPVTIECIRRKKGEFIGL